MTIVLIFGIFDLKGFIEFNFFLMIFFYSNKKLTSIFALRSIFVIIALFAALIAGEALWVFFGVSALIMIAELSVSYARGYCKITEDEIIILGNFLVRKSVNIEEVYLTLSYDDEWTFRTKEKEIRIQKKFIRKDQHKDFEEQLKRIRISVDQKKHLINK